MSVYDTQAWKDAAAKINLEEDKVPVREIPSVLINNDGTKVENAWEWMNVRRPQVLD